MAKGGKEKKASLKEARKKKEEKKNASLEETTEEVKNDTASFLASFKTVTEFTLKYWKPICVVLYAVIQISFFIFDYGSRFNRIDEKFDRFDESFDKLDTQLRENNKSMSSQIAALHSTIERLDEKMEKRINDLSKDYYEFKGKKALVITGNNIGAVQAAIDCVSNAEDSIGLDKSTVLWKDDVWGEDIVASDVKDEKLLLTYDANGTSNLFYGSFNEYGRWDGRCLINTYKDGVLYALTDATYDDGKLIGCQRVYATKVSGKIVWTASKTIVRDDENIEVSKSFIREKEIPIEFSMNEATTGNLLNVTDVKECFGRQVSYYSGRILYGSPNDNSGDAFWIKFDEQGKIVVFQNGIFTNGTLNDHNSNDGIKSWEIAWSDKYNKYYYYEEFFSNGNHDKGSIGKPVTVDDIYNLVKDFVFDFTDKWIESNNE